MVQLSFRGSRAGGLLALGRLEKSRNLNPESLFELTSEMLSLALTYCTYG